MIWLDGKIQQWGNRTQSRKQDLIISQEKMWFKDMWFNGKKNALLYQRDEES